VERQTLTKSFADGRTPAGFGKLFVISSRRSDGAEDGIRTRDLRFTKPLLYQLSYFGVKKGGGNMPSTLMRATRMIRR
jgi:hypothetical protein